MYVIAVDPGREKCGIAVMKNDGNLFYQNVIQTETLAAEVARLCQAYEPAVLVIGNGTTSRQAQAAIKAAVPELDVVAVDEYRTTDAARIRYWQMHPPEGWRRFLPTGLQVPPVPVDDYVAIILAERHLQGKSRK